MKFAISCLLLVCPAFSSGFFQFPSIGFALPGLNLSILHGTPPGRPEVPEPKSVKPVDTHALIRGAAEKHGVPAAFVKSIVAAESNFNCDAISAKGAIGLMQLMPETASEYGVDPSIPAENVDGGAHYLSVLLNRYHNRRNGFQCAIAAYNAGPAVVDHYRGIPPFRET